MQVTAIDLCIDSLEACEPGEYKRIARHLREIQRQPADLLSPDAAEIVHACRPVLEEGRLQLLLGRGFLLSQVIERWQSRSIWVISRADAEYPRRLKGRLREDSPAVLYGCGNICLTETGGLAVVGSRHVDDALIDYAMAIGQLAARSGRTLVSGGAKGIDQAAMRGALEAGGNVNGILADSLEKAAMNRENRNLLIDGRLVLVSPVDPSAGFHVGNAMQRNKLIYALADASLVVSSDLNKGGTWAGAVEQLDKLRMVPVYVRSTGQTSAGLDALLRKGALPWPNPKDADTFDAVFDRVMPTVGADKQTAFGLFSNNDAPVSAAEDMRARSDGYTVSVAGTETLPPSLAITEDHEVRRKAEQLPKLPRVSEPKPDGSIASARSELSPADTLFSTLRELIRPLLSVPMNEAEIAAALQISNGQAKAWLQRLVEEGILVKLNRPVRYVVRPKTESFSHDA